MTPSIQSLFELSGHTAVVTGGSSGIGLAIAGFLADAGSQVILVARREDRLKAAAAQIQAAGGKAGFVAADLMDRDQLPDTVSQVKAVFGEPDILVNAAGVNLRQHADEVTPDGWDQTLHLNLSTPFFLAQALVPGMKARRYGRIINIASMQSLRAFANGIAYGASKGGICQLTRAMAEAWSAQGITCNAIGPGFFPTELTAPVFDDDDRRAWAANQTAIGRNGEMVDLAGVSVFLAAPASGYITGQTIFVDGGFSAK